MSCVFDQEDRRVVDTEVDADARFRFLGDKYLLRVDSGHLGGGKHAEFTLNGCLERVGEFKRRHDPRCWKNPKRSYVYGDTEIVCMEWF